MAGGASSTQLCSVHCVISSRSVQATQREITTFFADIPPLLNLKSVLDLLKARSNSIWWRVGKIPPLCKRHRQKVLVDHLSHAVVYQRAAHDELRMYASLPWYQLTAIHDPKYHTVRRRTKYW